jgi:hypothetical protein
LFFSTWESQCFALGWPSMALYQTASVDRSCFKSIVSHMNFNTINDLVGNTRDKINKLNKILDVLLSSYRTASEIIDSKFDYRQTYLDQLLELNEQIGDIVDKHPAVQVDNIWQDATNAINAIAMNGKPISGTIK